MPSKPGFRSRLKGIFSHRDGAPTQDEVIKQDDHRGQTGTTALPTGSILPTSTSSTSSTSTNLAERLWDQAYDSFKLNNAALVQAYEKILSRKLGGRGFDSPMTESEQNIIAQNDTHERRNQMRQLIQEGLEKTAKEAKVKEAIGTATEFIFAAKEIISSAVQAAPQAALAWTGVCVALEMLQNPIAATEANRKGIEYVTKRMDWYWKLSSAVLKDNINDTSISEVRRELETQVIDLYKVLLSYEVKSVCSYYRNRGLALLRDIVSLDDWNGDMQAIQNAERVFHDDSNAYTGLQLVSNLEQLVTHAEMQSTAQITKEDQQCIKDLRLTDPSEDKKRIEQTKGGLLQESYTWVLHNPDYQEWRACDESRLLWIKGDPGKGKTMLLCGIIDELNRQSSYQGPVSYFFFQATDQHLNNATSALRGLVFMLVNQQPSLISHLRKKYDQAGEKLFEGPNTWIALSDIFTAILQDPSFNNTFLIVDALDECMSDLEKLLDLIVHVSGMDTRVKWIVSSRNWPQIEERLQSAEQKVKLSLELNAESISNAVDIYIGKKVERLSNLKKYDDKTRSEVRNYLSKNANDTFLWVALVCRNLENYTRWDVLQMLNAFLPGLNSLYERMMDQICMRNDGNVNLCKQILAVIMSVYRPVTLRELGCLIEIRQELSSNTDYLEEIVSLCGSFLTIREETVYFVHQSAKDYLSKNEDVILPYRHGDVHYSIFSLSLQAMEKTLRKNIYALPDLGPLPENTAIIPDTDPLSAVRYSCVHWVDHFCKGYTSEMKVVRGNDLNDDGDVSLFFRKHLLHWLEALSLLQHVSAGVTSIIVLKGLVATQAPKGELYSFLQDAHRFLLHNRRAIEVAPLQTYSSALVFSPLQSLVRKTFCQEIPAWIQNRPLVENNWSPCLQILEGHTSGVASIAFSADHQHIASGSHDSTIKIWDIATGVCIKTLNGHTEMVNSVTFLNNVQVVSASNDCTIKIWNITTGVCDQTLEGHTRPVRSVVVLANSHVASGSNDKTIKIWDIATGACMQTLEGHDDSVYSVASLANGQLASGSADETIKIWDIATGTCGKTLKGHEKAITSVAGLATGQVASGSDDETIKIWDIATGSCVQTFNRHTNWVRTVAFLNSRQVISGSYDETIKIWDITAGTCVQTLRHNSMVLSVVSLANGQLASGSYDKTIKIWDTSISVSARGLDSHNDRVESVALSSNGRQVASGSEDKTIKVWDVDTGACVQTLEGHTEPVSSVVFLNHGQVASGSYDWTVKTWDVHTGTCVQTLRGHERRVLTVASSSDGQYIASGSADKTVRIWDVAAGVCVRTLEDHRDWVRSVTFSMNTQYLATASDDKTAKVWDVTTGECIRTFEGHTGWAMSAAITADGRYAASGFTKGTKIWDVATGACILTLDVDTALHLSFHPKSNSRLYSNLSTIDLDLDLDSALAAVKSGNEPPLQRGVIRGYGIDSNLEWITKDGKPLLWLPAEYRPYKSAVTASTIVVGCESGRVFTMKFSETVPDI